jgi:hypothetical protein
MTKYLLEVSYDLDEFKNQSVDPKQLKADIEELTSTYVNTIVYENLVCKITFMQPLSETDLDDVDDVIQNHEGVIEKKNFLIYRYTNSEYYHDATSDPDDISYNVLGLHKEYTVKDGELHTVNYWGKCTLDEFGKKVYDDLVVSEERTYYRDLNDYLIKRTIEITWYFEDGTAYDLTKVTDKYYTPEEALEGGQKKRTYIINNTLIEAVYLISVTQGITTAEADLVGMPLIAEIAGDIQIYIYGNMMPLISKVATLTGDDFSFFENVIDQNGTTIRMYILSKINYKNLPI